MKTIALRVTVALAVALLPACTADTTTITPPARTVQTTTVKALAWGEMGELRSGVRVRVIKPQPKDPPTTTWQIPDDAPAGGRREFVCDVQVDNASDGYVRIGLSGMAGLSELIPKYEAVPAVPPRSWATVRRHALAPAVGRVFTVQISATVDGRAIGSGWMFSGGVA